MKILKCFVASAFGKTDVDWTYKNIIYPTLKSMQIKCRRVDRIEHNDDIDDKIIELINECDFCIADLTYARPSVYYESGYVNGLGKEVIFTARKDHFFHKEKDIHGNERIHFDLQMKNIIKWTKPEYSREFTQKLKTRINLITKPIYAKQKEEKKQLESRENFKIMSTYDRLSVMKGYIKEKLMKNKWSRIEPDFSSVWLPKNYLCFLKDRQICSVFVTSSVTKQEFKFVNAHRIAYQNSKYISKDRGRCHVIIISYRKIPDSRIEDMYPSISQISHNKYSYDGGDFSDWPSQKEWKNSRSFYHFISDVKSESEYKDQIDELFLEIEKC